jgi:hypothetical protein
MIAAVDLAKLDKTRFIRSIILKSIEAAGAYFVIVFAFGFGFGVLRLFVLTPRYGEWLALLIELPAMLMISWYASGLIVWLLKVPGEIAVRLAMGGLAFTLLIGAELGLSVFVNGRSVGDHFNLYQTSLGMTGLIAQFVFAFIPTIRLRWSSARADSRTKPTNTSGENGNCGPERTYFE